MEGVFGGVVEGRVSIEQRGVQLVVEFLALRREIVLTNQLYEIHSSPSLKTP